MQKKRSPEERKEIEDIISSVQALYGRGRLAAEIILNRVIEIDRRQATKDGRSVDDDRPRQNKLD